MVVLKIRCGSRNEGSTSCSSVAGSGYANQPEKEVVHTKDVVPTQAIRYVLDGSGAAVSVDEVAQAENATSNKDVQDELEGDLNSINNEELIGRMGDTNLISDDGEDPISSILPELDNIKLNEVELYKGGGSSVVESEEEEDVKPFKKKRKLIIREDEDLEDVKPAIRRGRVPRSSKAVAEEVEVFNVDEGDEVVVWCRPSGIVKLMESLTDKQLQAVEDIGFGSLSLIKLTEFPKEMIRWLCGCFVPSSRMFVMPTGKRFRLTANDVHDVFQIPIGPLRVPISNAHADSELKNTWKDLYGGAKHEVTVP